MGKAIAVVVALALSGCANMSYVLEHYGSMEPVIHKNRYDAFQVFDKPAEGRLMITSSVEAAMAGGFARGATFGASGPIMSKPIYQEAVEEYLAKSGRTCRITDAALVIEPNWEFRYDCSPAVAANVPPTTTGALRK